MPSSAHFNRGSQSTAPARAGLPKHDVPGAGCPHGEDGAGNRSPLPPQALLTSWISSFTPPCSITQLPLCCTCPAPEEFQWCLRHSSSHSQDSSPGPAIPRDGEHALAPLANHEPPFSAQEGEGWLQFEKCRRKQSSHVLMFPRQPQHLPTHAELTRPSGVYLSSLLLQPDVIRAAIKIMIPRVIRKANRGKME